jgi:hypothetical protein
MSWVGYVACVAAMRNAYWILFGKPERKRPLGRPKCRWENSIKVDVEEMGFEHLGWTHLYCLILI